MDTEFKVGDRVRLTGSEWGKWGLSGDIVTIAAITGPGEYTFSDKDGSKLYIWTGSGQLVRDWGAELVEGAEPDEPDAISPTYYQFPGHVEVRDISAHLTSFGGQALQYIARSTRLDGNNKGDPVENLKKAVAFLEWEIQRFEDLNGDGA